ncbi:hypothetical protein [Flavihumibacter sp. ZG627]|uniref:hypothetical protein n=1 Tax=Flavihumibacter sp. ZG627 TaxID=1463156 RepID=UPI0005801187|nr:hypothetical protein [Flavihumibacter sp. ZG627]KIC89638.1 hypothetical protein HY58_16130 [Flavihumibacter sp. ZG627]
MRRLTLIALLIITSFTGYSQQYKKTIEKQFLTYTNHLIEKDFKGACNYIIEDFFKIIPRDQLVLMMEKTFNNPDIEFAIDSPKIIKIEDSRKFNANDYARLQYSNLLRMKFIIPKEDGETVSEEEKEMTTSLTKANLEKTFGDSNVRYDAATGYFTIFSIKDVVATSADGEKWKFVVVEEKQKPILSKFLPKEMLR